MGIKVKGSDDPRKAIKARQAERLAAFSPTQNARVKQAISQSQNGFKGESLNDHGLPDGHVGREIIQKEGSNVSGPKSRSSKNNAAEDKFPGGTRGIKTKKGMNNFIHGEADKVKNMSDKDLNSALMSNMNFQTTKQNKLEEGLLDETVNRKWKKQGGYASGTKGIKTKKMC